MNGDINEGLSITGSIHNRAKEKLLLLAQELQIVKTKDYAEEFQRRYAIAAIYAEIDKIDPTRRLLRQVLEEENL